MDNQLDPLVGRDGRIGAGDSILWSAAHKNNPVLIGEPGVGKTAIVTKGWRSGIADGEVPLVPWRNKRILDRSFADRRRHQYRGQFEERF